MSSSWEIITTLQYRLKAAHQELDAFYSGEKYVRMEKQRLAHVRALECKVAKLEASVAKEHSHAITIRNQWFEIFEQLQKECDRKVAEAEKKAALMEKRAIRAERQRDAALDKVTLQRRELYKVKTELDDEKQRIQKLTAQINRNYENSSIPSSKSITRKKISNSREKTGRKPGGQPGHKGHCRKRLTPTEEVYLPAPEEVLNDPDFKKTSKTITKQKIDISIQVNVTEYHADAESNEVLPVSEKYMLTIKEAAAYFNIGIKKMRRIVEDNLGTVAVYCGNRFLIIRPKFEEFILNSSEISRPLVR